MSKRTITTHLGPADSREKARTLWKAKLRIQNERDEFLFRSSEDFSVAAAQAQELLDSSPSCQMVGAEITAVERVARLWN